MPLDAQPLTRLDAHPQDVVPAPTSAPMPCSRIQDGWIVVHCYAQAERWADQELTRRGYTSYLPMMTVRRRDRAIRSLWHNVRTPLFPRYLFVAFPGNWTPIRYCPGVYRLVSAAGKPNMATEAQIRAVQAAEAAFRCRGAETTQWRPGTPCALARGYAMEGLPAVVLSTSHDHASIAVMFLGALRQISVPLDALTARQD